MSSYFDPKDVIEIVPPPEKKKGASPYFADEDVLELLPPKDAPEESSVDRELRERSFFDRPVLGAEHTKQQEIEAIAKKHGVDKDRLLELAPYFGARMEDESLGQGVERGLGGIGQVFFGIPQKLYKSAQDPKMEAALDDMQALAGGRQSWLQFASEIAAPVGGISKSASVAKAALKGAGVGAVAGAAGARKDQELEGAATGAVFGAALAGVGDRLARGGSKLSKVESDVAQKQVVDIDRGTEELLSRRLSSESEIEKKILGDTQDLSQDASQKIVQEQYDPASLEKIFDPTSVEGAVARRRVDELRPKEVRDLGYERAIEHQLAEDVLTKRTINLASDLSGTKDLRNLDEAQEILRDWTARQGGKEALKEAVRLQSKTEAALEHISQAGIREGRGDNFGDKALNWISDAQFPLRDIGTRFGLDLESVHQKLNSLATRMSFPRLEFRADLEAIRKAAADSGLDKRVTEELDIYRALDEGSIDSLSKPEKNIAQAFKDYFSKGLSFVNEKIREKDPTVTPLSIPKLEDYVPHILKGTSELIAAFEQKTSEALREASLLVGRRITDLRELAPKEFAALADKSAAVKDMTRVLQLFDAKAIANAADLHTRIQDTFHSRSGRVRLASEAKAALERKGDIPLWARETNMYKLADRWAQNTLKHVYLRKPLAELKAISKKVKAAGGELESQYIDNLITDILGVRKGTAAEWASSGKLAYLRKIDQVAGASKNPGVRAGAAVAKALPFVLEDLNKQVYPNLLGLSPRALIMNATQVWAKTAPELGTKYGYTTVLRGAISAVLNFRKQIQKLEQQGLAPAEFVSKYNRATAEGIRRNALYALPMEALTWLGEKSMFLYTKMDALNRSIALSTAEIMAADLARGSKLANQSLRRFPATIQKEVQRAGSEQEVGQILARYLNATTQYNYNRISMSQFGRTMGPFFSTFSKWPTATAGEVIQEYRQRGITGGTRMVAEKFVAPYLLFRLADELIKQVPGLEEEGDRRAKLLGKQGLAGSAPIGSMKSIVTGDFFTPPAVDAVVQSLVPLLDPKKGEIDPLRGLADTVGKFAPGAVYVRFLTDDLPAIAEGQRPEGSNFMERSAEGIRRITK